MARSVRGAGWGLLAVLALLPLNGCQWGQRKPYANDPLLRQRRPVAGTPATAVNSVATSAEPFAPPPPSAVPTGPPRDRVLVTTDPTLTPPPPDPVQPLPAEAQPPATPATAVSAAAPLEGPILPAVEPLPPAPPPPTPPPVAPLAPPGPLPLPESAPAAQPPTPPVSPITTKEQPPTPVSGTYGKAPDHRWLQGVLDRHYRGHLELRFCDPSADDAFGGKVRLEDDPRLKDFADGDVLYVEGELAVAPAAERGGDYPPYRVREVRLVKKGEGGK